MFSPASYCSIYWHKKKEKEKGVKKRKCKTGNLELNKEKRRSRTLHWLVEK